MPAGILARLSRWIRLPEAEGPLRTERIEQLITYGKKELGGTGIALASGPAGQLIVDATCAPADIRYPTDVSLLNEAREKTDEIVDELHTPLVGKAPRPRTYRVKARRRFVAFTKKKQPSRRVTRRAQKQQLGFLSRNFKAIDRLLNNPAALPLAQLSHRRYKNLLVCRELYRQQLEMVENHSQRVDDRIVSIV